MQQEAYSSREASSSGVEASLESRGVMRDVRPNSESQNGMKEAAGLGEAMNRVLFKGRRSLEPVGSRTDTVARGNVGVLVG